MRRRLHRRTRYRQMAGITVAAALGLATAACSSSSSSSSGSTTGASGPVSITVNCAPPSTEPPQYKEWNEDVATFEKQNPNITIHSEYAAQCIVPATFTAMLDAGTEPNVFGGYFTDLNQILDAGQAADITPYVNSSTVPNWNDIQPGVKKSITAGTTIYGLPAQNYTQGLVYNRTLFQQAGLNPDQPPTTWAQVEADAKAITKLGNGIFGFGDYSANNNGGWHFTSYMDALGGQMVTNSANGPQASFNNANGQAILEALHQMRFVDHSMSPTQQLAWGALQKQMAAGKLGMYIAAPDDVYGVIVPQDGGNINDIGMGPLPSLSGTPSGSLSGGNAFFFAKKDTPAQIAAGIKWVNFQDETIGQGQFNYARSKADGVAVGFPEPEFFTGAAAQAQKTLENANATINTSYYAPFLNANEVGDGEPLDAQAIYKTLDATMLAVLTQQNANIPALLATATTQANQILSISG
jgi:ABC-type glycerol-3-phosphate transport system substrate-binding protein